MKKSLICMLLMVCLMLGLTIPAYAADPDWIGNVVFTANAEMQSDFTTGAIDKEINKLQPGDQVMLRITLSNKYNKTTDWYMSDRVIQSLEETFKKGGDDRIVGGGYSYKLVYNPNAGVPKVLFDSDRVGGEGESFGDDIGLHQATNNLEEFFYLDTYTGNQGGNVELYVSLEGESQGNDYQDTLAHLQMQFAVDLRDSNNRIRIVKTGDDYRIVPLYVAMVVSGLVFMYFALDVITDRMYNGKKRRG